MIRYRVELACDGCAEFAPFFRTITEAEGLIALKSRIQQLVETAKRRENWVVDKTGAHFCPKCQVQLREPSGVVWRRGGEHAT